LSQLQPEQSLEVQHLLSNSEQAGAFGQSDFTTSPNITDTY
jgi:hypothetical protein